MKILIIGGTGTISSAITRQLAAAGHDLSLLNRGTRQHEVPEGVRQITADINDGQRLQSLVGSEQWDVVCDFIAFHPEQVERDVRLFAGRTGQYVFISSASAYHKPAPSHIITEGTTLSNPHWLYSRQKIACEELLLRQHREHGFPVTIVRPSHTYCERSLPLSVHGPGGSWQVVQRMLQGKPVIIHGDGTSLWTLTWNEDFARGFIGLLGNPRAIGEAFQITSDEALSWTQIYQCVASALGVTLHPCYVASAFLASVAPPAWDYEGNLLGDKALSAVFDCTKLRRAVPTFQCATPFSEGARRAVAHILAHPGLQTPDPEFDAWCDRVVEAQQTARQAMLQHGKEQG